MLRPFPLFGAFLVLGLCGCGGGGGGGSKPASDLTVTAPVDRILPGGTVALTAFKKGGGKVTWSVVGGDANGTVTSSGVYTAPSTQGAFTVQASVGDLVATKTITVSTGIAIALTSTANPPLSIPKSKLFFTASVTGASDKTVLWTAKDAAGTAVAGAIASDGTFTAPATGTYTIVGTAKADPTKSVSESVSVVANVNVRMAWTNSDGVAKGDVLLSLRPDKAPNTVANYVTLVNKGFYNGIVLHRYEADFVVQWGDPLTKTLPLSDPSIGTGGPGYTIPFELNDLSNVKYSLAMARSNDLDSGGSQVYINLKDNPTLDSTPTSGYVVFGATAAGTDVVDALRRGDQIANAKTEAVP